MAPPPVSPSVPPPVPPPASSASPPAFAAIVVAAGSGSRAGQPVPKQFAPWRGQPVVRHAVAALAAQGARPIVVAIPPGCEAMAQAALAGVGDVVLIPGGATRQASVANALAALEGAAPARVLIHDAARPDVPGEVAQRLLAALETADGAIPVLPVVDSVITAAGDRMAAPADRAPLRRVQTPQAFRYPAILSAHRAWAGAPDAGDDAQVLHAAGRPVALVAGDARLAKLTFAEDFLPPSPSSQPAPVSAAPPAFVPVRVGMGYDVHRLVPGEELWLGGQLIPHSHGLSGHSDADVALHAITDAILGALGEGDIGTHFPPSDPQWKGAASATFLAHAAGLARAAGYAIGHVDCTLICETPKIGPHRPAMRARIASLLGVGEDAVSVKATTTEGLGFAGRREGIAAQAVATLLRIG